MSKLVECVPNFSEGRNSQVIAAISNAIKSVSECVLLDIDVSELTNRSIFTFVGEPETVLKAALASAHVAYQLIDMTHHIGLHPRIGALDVCPFIPVSNISLEECIELSILFAKMLFEQLHVPIYLYEHSQPIEYRRSLTAIRKGEYEGLKSKMSNKNWAPDFYSAEFYNPTFGATCVGARDYLIAFTISLTAIEEQADIIGKQLMNMSQLKCGKIASWFIKEKNVAQIAINLPDYKKTNIHDVFIACENLIQSQFQNVYVKNTEIVGLIPLQAMLNAANYFVEKDKLSLKNKSEKINLVVKKLKLDSLHFKPREKIIDYLIEDYEH